MCCLLEVCCGTTKAYFLQEGREGKKGARDRGWKEGRESKSELKFINFHGYTLHQ